MQLFCRPVWSVLAVLVFLRRLILRAYNLMFGAFVALCCSTSPQEVSFRTSNAFFFPTLTISLIACTILYSIGFLLFRRYEPCYPSVFSIDVLFSCAHTQDLQFADTILSSRPPTGTLYKVRIVSHSRYFDYLLPQRIRWLATTGRLTCF